jgi:hypothetical protein
LTPPFVWPFWNEIKSAFDKYTYHWYINQIIYDNGICFAMGWVWIYTTKINLVMALSD